MYLHAFWAKKDKIATEQVVSQLGLQVTKLSEENRIKTVVFRVWSVCRIRIAVLSTFCPKRQCVSLSVYEKAFQVQYSPGLHFIVQWPFYNLIPDCHRWRR